MGGADGLIFSDRLESTGLMVQTLLDRGFSVIVAAGNANEVLFFISISSSPSFFSFSLLSTHRSFHFSN